MKAGWEVKALGEIIEKLETVDPRKTPETEFEYVDVSSVSKETFAIEETTTLIGSKAPSRARRKIRTNDVIFATIRPTLRRIAYVSADLDQAICSTGYMVLRSKPSILPKYLFYYLFSADYSEAMESLQKGASYPAVTDGEVRQQPIPLPPLDEQKRIVAVLDAAFNGLARARANVEANLQNARELFESYREIYLDPAKRSNWSFEKLDDLITIKHGFAFKSAYFVDKGDYAVLTPGNYYETGGFRDRGEKQRYYSGEFPKAFLLNRGDLLTVMTEQAPGLLGSCIVVPNDGCFLHNQRLGLIMPKDNVSWSPEYFAQVFNLKAFRKGLSDTCSGATVRHTSPGRILSESIPYTNDLAELECAAVHLAAREQDCLSLQNTYQTKLAALDELRQSLLQKAFAGELT